MKEFIEKLIGRLEEQAEQYRRRGFEHEEKGYSAMADKYYGKQCSYLHSIEIVSQLAEEHKEQHSDQDLMIVASLPSLYPLQPFEVEAIHRVVGRAKDNSGWIPCSERLPEIDGNTSDVVLVCTVDGFQHMAFWCDDKKWRYCESGMIKNTMEWTEIIAWQPLPAPYQPKGE